MADTLDCSGCKISMFCHRKDPDTPQETNLWAVLVAFGIPLAVCVAILIICQGRVGEGMTALCILGFMTFYYFILWLIRPHFECK